MTIADYITQLETVRQSLPQKGEEIAKEVSQIGTDIVRDRSIADGINVDGIDGNKTPYSRNGVATTKFKGKELNQAGKDFIKKNRLGTWEDFREAQGKPKGDVNLNYTGVFWESIKQNFIKASEGSTSIIVNNDFSLASRYPDGTKLFEYVNALAFRYGNVLKPTVSEEFILKSIADAKMRTYLISQLTAK